MAIKDVEEKLYSRDTEKVEKKSLEYEALNPKFSGKEPFRPVFATPVEEKDKSIWIKAEKEKKEKRKKILKISGAIFAAIVLVVGLVWVALLWRQSAFSEEKVKIEISGPESVQSGDTVNFEITISNENRSSLKDAVLFLGYPENFRPFGNLQFEQQGSRLSKLNIGTVDSKKQLKISFQGKFYGPKDFIAYVESKVEYSSPNFSSRFDTKSKVDIFISSTPLSIEASGPQNVASGGSVSYKIIYRNSGEGEFKDIKIKAEYPTGFSFSTSEPLPAIGENIWYVGNLEAGRSGEVNISGSLAGFADEVKNLKFYIGELGEKDEFISYGEIQIQTKIVGSAISISQTVNDQKDVARINAGETLIFKIHFKNTSQIGLRDVVLTEEINSPILNYQELRMEDEIGSFNSKTGVITWTASGAPKLALLNPGQEGEITFSIPVKSVIPVESSKDKNFSIRAIAKMDSPDVPTPEGANKIISSNILNLKLNSKLMISEEGFYNDSEIANSGPIPLKVGKETTFTMHAKISNVSNDITDAKVVFSLAPGVIWKNNFLSRNADVSFNGRTNELVWNVGMLPAGIGIITDPKEFIFQIGIVPSQNQIGSYPSLISKSVFSAKDTFTGRDLQVGIGEKNTDLREDISIGEGGKVSN